MDGNQIEGRPYKDRPPAVGRVCIAKLHTPKLMPQSGMSRGREGINLPGKPKEWICLLPLQERGRMGKVERPYSLDDDEPFEI